MGTMGEQNMKPCPFCGCKDIRMFYEGESPKFIKFAMCTNCLVNTFYDKWNDRPIEDELSEKIKKIQSGIEWQREEIAKYKKMLEDYGVDMTIYADEVWEWGDDEEYQFLDVDTLLMSEGKSQRCEECGSNVFRLTEDKKHARCNGCRIIYETGNWGKNACPH